MIVKWIGEENKTGEKRQEGSPSTEPEFTSKTGSNRSLPFQIFLGMKVSIMCFSLNCSDLKLKAT